MPERSARLERATKESKIKASLHVDGRGDYDLNTGIPFFDHMLSILARHSGMDLMVHADGDLHIDDHHTVEDVGIVLGEAFARALGEKRSITRFATAAVPLDESLSLAVVDISGRGGFYLHGEFPRMKTGNFDTYLAGDFFHAFAVNAGITLHIELKSGSNPHHMVETAFKALAVALRQAVDIDTRIVGVPSTKGVL